MLFDPQEFKFLQRICQFFCCVLKLKHFSGDLVRDRFTLTILFVPAIELQA